MIAIIMPRELRSLVGELRDAATMRIAPRAADTAALVGNAILDRRISSQSQAIAHRASGLHRCDQLLTDLRVGGQISGTKALRLSTNPDAVALVMRGSSSLDMASDLVR